MPVAPNLLERLVLFRLNKAPAPLLDLFGAAGFEAVTLAVDVGLFEALSDGPLTAAELAARIDAHEDGVRALLGFLDAQGYVSERDGRYRNTRMTTKWVTTGSPTSVAPWLTFWDELVFPFWEENLEAAIRTGEPPETLYEWLGDDEDRWETTQRGFRAAASVVAEEVRRAVDVPEDASAVLDVGGGHGLFAVELCRSRPGLSATVVDHPAALGLARETIGEAELDDRVTTRGADYLVDDLGEGFDLALAFNIVHAHDRAETVRLFERVHGALAPGGRIAVLDQFVGSARTPVGRAGLGFVALTYLATLGATLPAFDEVAEWLGDAGFEGIERTAIRAAGPGNTLLQATKKR